MSNFINPIGLPKRPQRARDYGGPQPAHLDRADRTLSELGFVRTAGSLYPEWYHKGNIGRIYQIACQTHPDIWTARVEVDRPSCNFTSPEAAALWIKLELANE